MRIQRMLEIIVGLFLLAAILALMVLAFKVSGLTSFFKPASYHVTAQFDDIGQLKVRAPVKISGVLVGEVSAIKIDPTTYKAVVTININNQFHEIPADSSASILTAGLLGDNYIALSPMYSEAYLKNDSIIQETHSAMVLEKLIGQLVFKMSNSSKEQASPATPATSNATSGETK